MALGQGKVINVIFAGKFLADNVPFHFKCYSYELRRGSVEFNTSALKMLTLDVKLMFVYM